MMTSEQIHVPVDPCEIAYSAAIEEIYELAGSGKSFEQRVLMPVINAAASVKDQYSGVKLSKNEDHKLQSQVAYDIMCRLQANSELDPEDNIIWRQTDNEGEEWVEYSNTSGETYGINHPGLKYGFGKLDANKNKKYDELLDRSYEYENDYDIVKKLFSAEFKDSKSRKEVLSRGMKRIVKAAGLVAFSGLTFFYAEGMFGSTQVPNDRSDRSLEEVAAKQKKTTATTAAPITTTSRPYVPYSTSPIEGALNSEGKLIEPAFKVRIDAMCEDSIYVYEMQQSRVKDIGTARNATPIDVMVPDETPLSANCERVNEFKAQNPGAVTRIERIKDSFDIVDGERVNAAYYQPIGVHIDDKMYPGEKGNFVLMWHGSTRNAAGANTAILKPGDTMETKRDDGYVSVYEYVDREIHAVPDEDDNSAEATRRREEVTRIIWDYKNAGSESTATTVRCGDKDGKTGSDESREIIRWKLKYSYQLPNAA